MIFTRFGAAGTGAGAGAGAGGGGGGVLVPIWAEAVQPVATMTVPSIMTAHITGATNLRIKSDLL